MKTIVIKLYKVSFLIIVIIIYFCFTLDVFAIVKLISHSASLLQ